MSLRAAPAVGFQLQWAANDTTCSQCIQSGGRCGSNTTSNSTAFVCYCADQPYPLECVPITTGNGPTKRRLLIALIVPLGFLVVAAGFTILLVVTSYSHRQRCLSVIAMFLGKKERIHEQNIEALIENYGSLTPKRYSYSDSKKMTNSFREKVGQGGGAVYKGKLSGGRPVAVKILSETRYNGEEFINETCISKTSHVNVITLLGFCYQRNRRALIYEFMANGSLDKFINNDESQNTTSHLEWKTLFQIAVGIARDLEYLHRGCNKRIVHFDIKSHNIVLDEDFCPKISDFGLTKLCQRKKSIVSVLGARGTPGFIASKMFCQNFGGVSHKFNVYSYGMRVLEMAGTSKNHEVGGISKIESYFPEWIYLHLERGEDLGIEGLTTEEGEETAKKMVLVSLWCVQNNPAERPSMSNVIEMLKGSLQSLQIFPKHVLFSPAKSLLESLTTLSSNWEENN